MSFFPDEARHPPLNSLLMLRNAFEQNPASPCPKEIIKSLVSLKVPFIGFDEAVRWGQIVVHEDCAPDLADFFSLLWDMRFPIGSVVPISHPLFAWDDERSMAANNSSGWNYRKKAFSDELSLHATGRAFDLNPVQNPCIMEGRSFPPGAVYDPSAPGTLTFDSPGVQLLIRRGWHWGGRHPEWRTLIDYQHFEKPE